MRSPFSLYIKNLKSGSVWYARYYDEKTEKYTISRSTGIPCTGKKGRKIEAYKAAEKIAETLIDERSPFLIPFLESFWTNNSKYAKHRKAIKKPLSVGYVSNNANGIKNHVKEYEPFQKIRISELTTGMIIDWQTWCSEKGLGARNINAVMQAMSVPLRWKNKIDRGQSNSRGMILYDPFEGVQKIPEEIKEKGVLTIDEVNALIHSKEKDPRAKLSVLLAVLGGLRRGEARGLRWMDIDWKNRLLNLQNNFIDEEGNKSCKTGSARTVIIPESVIQLIKAVKSISPQTEPTDYILFNTADPKMPLSKQSIRGGFERMLKEIGIDAKKRKARNLCYHGMRHTFVTLARISGISEIEVQALAGHASAAMMENYSHAAQVIDYAAARKRLFGNQDPTEEEAKANY